MKHGFGDTVKQQPDSHACTEEHGKPAGTGELRFRIGTSKTDITVATDHEDQHKHQNYVHGHDKKPARTGCDAGLKTCKKITDPGLKQNCQGDRTYNQKRRCEKDPGVNIDGKPALLFFPVIVHKDSSF